MKKKTLLKILTIVISLVVLIAVIYPLIPTIKNISTAEGRMFFRDEIQNLGIKGAIYLFVLQAVQMIFVVLPGEPIEVLYGMCYGSVWGAVLLTVSVFINTVIVYKIVQLFGRKILVFFFSESKIQKIEQSKLLKNSKKVEKIIILLFFLPGTPKDLLLYLGALLPIEKKKFILISTFVRFPSVITSTIAGDNIVSGKLYISIAIYIVTAVILFFILKKSNKTDEETSKFVEAIK